VVLVLAVSGPVVASAQNQSPGAARDEYVPIDQLPPEAELPAAPMVVAAYTFVWAAFLVYIFTLVKRLKKIEADLRHLEQPRR
jgi:CcmD family protein